MLYLYYDGRRLWKPRCNVFKLRNRLTETRSVHWTEIEVQKEEPSIRRIDVVFDRYR